MGRRQRVRRKSDWRLGGVGSSAARPGVRHCLREAETRERETEREAEEILGVVVERVLHHVLLEAIRVLEKIKLKKIKNKSKKFKNREEKEQKQKRQKKKELV